MSDLAYLQQCKAERMAYWDRAKVAKEQRLTFRVYVPRAGATSVQHIKPGSGIVGVADDGLGPDQTLIYYEGGVYDRETRPYSDLVYHAADRMAVAYPTIATAVVPTDDLIHVGYFDYGSQVLVVSDQAALDTWKGVSA